MTLDFAIPLLALAGALVIDSLVHPRPAASFRPWRSPAGVWLALLIMLVIYGGFLALCGNWIIAGVLTLALHGLFALTSNAKRAMLGEPLLFSDLALVLAVFRHPQFYLSALATWQKAALVVVAPALLAALVWLFVPSLAVRSAGVALVGAALVALALTLRLAPMQAIATRPQAEADVERHGLLPALLLYWLRWRGMTDPPTCPPQHRLALPGGAPSPGAPPQVVVVVQCESFADPVELFGEQGLALPALTAARAQAWRWGNLAVSGFGAYTMRTEYGVIFGRTEDELGFRRYDPFLTAAGDGSYALPARLGTDRWRSLFVHPHDLRFYRRDRVLPKAGFSQLVGDESFNPPAAGTGRYVSDAAIGDKILQLASAAADPALIYAVTIENHGPWSSREGKTPAHLIRNYHRLVSKGDALLAQVRAGLAELQKPALLVFFGDHRPSIPGLCLPGGARHTPYVMLRLDQHGQAQPSGANASELTPAQLHHAILEATLGHP